MSASETSLIFLVDNYLCRFQIEGFEVKRVDEYHLTGIALDSFVKWERRHPSSGDGRGGDNRHDGRGGDGKPKAEQKKFDDGHFTEGMVGSAASLNSRLARRRSFPHS